MGNLVMSDKERLHKEWMVMVAAGQVKLVKAALEMGVSYRQAKRIWQAYRQSGDSGLVHRRRGGRANNQIKNHDAIVERYRARYMGFGPTLASEKLEEEGLPVVAETLRRWLLKEGLWTRARMRLPYRQRRERREQFGELLQLDGSIHDWFGEGRHRCLLNLVDDATGRTLARMEDGETTKGVMRLLLEWIGKYGIPAALYVDLKNVYVSPKKDGMSHIQRICKKLNIRVIKARSPQAKGRVERNHAVYQDRFVKELALKDIKTIAEANALLAGGFVANLNRKFEKPAKNPASAHRCADDRDLQQIFCLEYKRQLQHDWTFQYRNQVYQVKKAYGSLIRPKHNVSIRCHLDASVSFWCEQEEIGVTAIDKLATRGRPVMKACPPVRLVPHMEKKGTPWRTTNSSMFRKAKRTGTG